MGAQGNQMSEMRKSNPLIPPHARPCQCDECAYVLELRKQYNIRFEKQNTMDTTCNACREGKHCNSIYGWCSCKEGCR